MTPLIASLRARGTGYLLASWVLIALVAAQSTAIAQNASWVNPSGGFYDSSSNWVPSAVPGPTSNVLVNVAGAYDIRFLADRSANSLSLSNNLDVTFSSGGFGDVEWTFDLAGDATINRAELTLGDLTQGRLLSVEVGGKLAMQGGKLNLLNGAQLTSQTSLSNSNTIEGSGAVDSTVIVSGADADGQPSRWVSGGGTKIGGSGGPSGLAVLGGGLVASAGSLSIGGDVMADGSSLEVRGTSADGAPSSLTSGFFQLGFVNGGGGLSRATAQVADGANVVTGGVQVFRDSRVIVDREDANRNPSRWEAVGFQVFGGFVDVLGGGHLASDSLSLDRLAIARVEGVGANGRPSRWDVQGNVRLGSSNGFGSLLIDSGRVTSDTAEIGAGTGNSLLSVEGQFGAPGVWENTGDVYVGGSEVGPEADGLLRLFDDDARVDIGGALTIWGPGSVRIHGGQMKVDVVNHVSGGVFEFNAGTLGANRFNGDLQNVAGRLSPGVDIETGSTILDGDYTQQSGATLAVDIGGVGPGSTYDLVNITGEAQLDGLLEVALAGGFTPDASDEFTVLAADNLIGFFDNVATGQRIDTSDGLGSFVVNYGIGSAFDETRVVLSDFQSSGLLPGDYNHDGVVDAADYTVWRDGGSPDNSQSGRALWANNYGATAGTSIAIPEPSGAALIAVLLYTGQRRRERRIA